MSTREQIKQLRIDHPDWTKVQLARAVKPPVSPQRIGQIDNGRDFKSDKYRAYSKHRYHKKVNKFVKKCKLCKDSLLLDKQ